MKTHTKITNKIMNYIIFIENIGINYMTLTNYLGKYVHRKNVK